jgi:hypothetical protein
MEREFWKRLYPALRAAASGIRQKGVSYQPWHLAAVLLWAALHDRPVSWACDRRNWPSDLRPARLPSGSTISRRGHSLGVGLALRALQEHLAAAAEPDLAAVIDGKPLPVGGPSKDPDAKVGRGAGRMARGYKLHAVYAGRPMPEAWEVHPLNVDEVAGARRLIPLLSRGGYLLGDAQFDANDLDDLAAASGYQLVAPPPRGAKGTGHRPQSPHRLRGLDLLRGAFGGELYAGRGAIERRFANATSFAGGLGPLPAWVRRMHRVRSWVWAKLLIAAVRAIATKRLRA